MSSDLTLYMGNALCRYFAGTAMPTAPTGLYVALYDGDPKGAGTEVTTTIRAAGRVACPVTSPAVGNTNTMSNNADVDFGNAAGAVANLSHFAIFDAASAGNMLAAKPLTGGPFSVSAGRQVLFVTGDLDFTFGS